jgi:hypothetical protein
MDQIGIRFVQELQLPQKQDKGPEERKLKHIEAILYTLVYSTLLRSTPPLHQPYATPRYSTLLYVLSYTTLCGITLYHTLGRMDMSMVFNMRKTLRDNPKSASNQPPRNKSNPKRVNPQQTLNKSKTYPKQTLS